MHPTLPPPADLDAPIRELVAELAYRLGESAAVEECVALLTGEDPHDHAQVLLAGTWADYWARTWGARGLFHVWRDSAEPAVVAGLEDEHWRPAETCLKVAAARELAGAADGAVDLAGHRLPRVRACALRALGRAGDTEHVATVRTGLEDPHPDVRRAAGLALERMAARLDLTEEVLP
jgi:HEAT repeat protein